MTPLETIRENGVFYAIILRREFRKPGVTFITESTMSQQMGLIDLPKGHKIKPHLHHVVKREINDTLEALFIRKGKLKVDFYRPDQTYLISRELTEGDTILLFQGGHGFECLEPLEMIEIKQGPYVDVTTDKVRFEPKLP